PRRLSSTTGAPCPSQGGRRGGLVRPRRRGTLGAMRAPTLDDLLALCVEARLLDAATAQRYFQEQDRQRARLSRDRRLAGEDAEAISALDLLASFDPRRPDGAPVGEEALTELYARRLGLPYVKLDPLELDADFVTSVLSKPFARKHSMIAVEDRGDALRVATSSPLDPLAFESVE